MKWRPREPRPQAEAAVLPGLCEATWVSLGPSSPGSNGRHFQRLWMLCDQGEKETGSKESCGCSHVAPLLSLLCCCSSQFHLADVGQFYSAGVIQFEEDGWQAYDWAFRLKVAGWVSVGHPRTPPLHTHLHSSGQEGKFLMGLQGSRPHITACPWEGGHGAYCSHRRVLTSQIATFLMHPLVSCHCTHPRTGGVQVPEHLQLLPPVLPLWWRAPCCLTSNHRCLPWPNPPATLPPTFPPWAMFLVLAHPSPERGLWHCVFVLATDKLTHTLHPTPCTPRL